MNSKQIGDPRLGPGESILPRKRHMNLQMEANVYQQATNLQPPLDPPQPPLDPAQPPADTVIAKLLERHFNGHALVKRPTPLDLVLCIARAAAKDLEPEPKTQLCQQRTAMTKKA